MDQRARYVKLLHVARRELGMDDDGYRAALRAATGEDSSKGLTVAQLRAALEHFKRCGFKIKPARPAGTRPQADMPQDRLIRHLWLSLHDAGVVRDRSEAALAAWVKRETGVDALQWVDADQASSCIEKLKKWLARSQ